MNTPSKRKAAPSQFIKVRRVTNPFEPMRDVREEQWKWRKTYSLDRYLPLGEATDIVVSVNGVAIQREQFKKTRLQAGDYVVICPVPRGGGGKGILRVVGMLAIAVAAAYTGGAAAMAYTGASSVGAAMGTTAGMVVAAGASAAVTIAGSMLLNAMLPPAVATASTNNGLAGSSTYGADGAKNTSSEMIPVPVPYGTFRMAGNIIGVHTEADGNNQILYMLIDAGEGPIASISDIKINDRALSEYAEVQVQTRLGDPMQTPIDWFSSVITPYQKNVKLPADGSYLTFATQGNVEAVRLDFNFPQGLYSINTKNGNVEQNSVALEADYRLAGTSAWQPFSTQAATYKNVRVQPITKVGIGNVPPVLGDGTSSPWDSTQIITDLNITTDDGNIPDVVRQSVMSKFGSYVGQNIGAWPVSRGGVVSTSVAVAGQAGALVVTEALRATARRTFQSPTVAAGKYEVRVRRNPNYIDYAANKGSNAVKTDTSATAASDCYVTDLNEITFDGVGYNHTALLALRVRMDDQLSGVPTVTFVNGGRVITVFSRASGVITSTQAPSNNAAWVLWDALTHTRYGGGLDPSRLDQAAFFDMAEYCTANGLTFDGVFDTAMNLWDATNYIARCGHSQLVPVGTRYTVVTEKPRDPVMMFGMGNIVEGTFKQSWMARTDRATEVDVTFFDKTDDNKQKTVKVSDATAALEGRPQNTAAITAYGVVDIQRAYKEGALQLNINRYLTQTCEWDSPIEAIACAAGDVVLLQHDQPAWGESGRLEQGSSATVVKLDKLVTMEAGKAYKLLVLGNTATRLTGTVTGVQANFLSIPGTPTALRVRRVRNAAGVETAVTAAVPDGVYVESSAGFAPGQQVSLIDTDVIEDHDVIVQPGATDTVTLTSALSFVPDPFTIYMFGETAKVKKPFSIQSITLGSSDMHRHLQALEYRAEVYDLSSYADVGETLTPPLLDPAQAAIGAVQNLSVYEETFVSGSQILTNVRAAWAQPMVGNYAGGDVYLQVNGGAFAKVGTVKADTSFIVPGVKKGDNITVLVQAFDIWGKYSAYDQAPRTNYTVIGNVTNLSSAAVSGADFIWAGRDCKLYWNYNSTTASFEFGSEPEGANGARDPHFQDYEVRVYDLTHKLLRTEHTTDNSYIYTFEKNFADGLHRHLSFEIAVRDVFGHVGKPAVLDAYNPPPTVLSAETNAAFDRIQLNYVPSEDVDFAGAMFYMSDVSPVKLIPENLAYDGAETSVLLTNVMFNHDYYIVIAPYDAFGKDELIPTNEIHVHTPFLDVEAIAEGVLKDSQLIPALQTRIDMVDAPDSLIGSVNQRLKDTAASVTAAAALADDAVKAALTAALNTAITSSQSVSKTVTDALSVRVDTVSAATDSNGAAIRTEQTARANADGALGTRIDTVVANTGNNTAAINTEITARTNADGALSSRIDTLVATGGSNSAAITAEQTARVNADGALSSRIDTISAQTGSNAAAITTEQTARTNADTALSTRLDLVAANVGNNTAAIQTEQSARASAASSLATQITTVAASYGVDATNLCANPVAANGSNAGWTANTAVGGATGDVPLGAPAAYVFRQNIRENSYTTRTVPVAAGQTHYLEMRAATPVAAVPIYLGLRLSGAAVADTWVWAGSLAASATWSRLAGNVTIPSGYTSAQLMVMIDFGGGVNNDKNRWYYTDIEWRPASQVQPAMAAISTEQTARASADSALSTRIDSVNASLGATNANVQTEINARAAGDQAQANYTTQVNSRVDGNVASIQSQQSSINGLNAQYVVKIDNNGYVAGFGLASFPINGGIVSEFAVRADTFSVQLPGYPGIHPFTIGAVYGVPRVIISNALIGDASIDNAKIGDAQINGAKIQQASINSAHIGVAQIDTLRIGANAVSTMACWSGIRSDGNGRGLFNFGYQANGGALLMMITANAGVPTGEGSYGNGGVIVSANGDSFGASAYGNATSFKQMPAANGVININVQCNGATDVTLVVFEAKR